MQLKGNTSLAKGYLNDVYLQNSANKPIVKASHSLRGFIEREKDLLTLKPSSLLEGRTNFPDYIALCLRTYFFLANTLG